MINPAIVVVSPLMMNVRGWKLVDKTIGLVVDKLSNGAGLTLTHSVQDLMGNISNDCTNEEHELAPYDEKYGNDAGPCYICIHCLQKFKMATCTVSEGTFLTKDGT